MTLNKYNAIEYRGMNLMSLLLALMLFSGIFLTITQWTSYQRKKAVKIYQTVQAVQIAENQKQRLFFELPCEKIVEQNHIKFNINCSLNSVIVHSKISKIVSL